MMKNLSYTVSWYGPFGMVYQQDFDDITEARMALALHNSRGSKLTVKQK
jgi:hypothetical protein